MEDDSSERAQKWLEDLAKGSIGHEIENLSLEGLQILHARKGLIRCNFVIPRHLSDQNGNWHIGAIATLVDDVGGAAIFSTVGHLKASVIFHISYYSIPKIQEEVEIEAKVVGEKGKLASVVVEVKRKDNGGMVALAKQWMTSTKMVPKGCKRTRKFRSGTDRNYSSHLIDVGFELMASKGSSYNSLVRGK